MPAIHLHRLRKQVAALADLFNQPEAFVRSISDLFEEYADRVHRPGLAGEPRPLMPAYNVPPPMLRHLTSELAPLATISAPETLALCDLLWEHPYLETRLVTISLLGMAPIAPVDNILNRIHRWAGEVGEARLIKAMAQQGLERMSTERNTRILVEIEGWLDSKNSSLQRLGLCALLPLIQDRNFENLPVILDLLSPFLRTAPLPIRPDVLDVVAGLARRSPRETAFMLRQNLEAPDNPDTSLLIRQSLPHFPKDIQESLRLAVRSRR